MAQQLPAGLFGMVQSQQDNAALQQNQLSGLATLLKLKQAQEEQPVRMDLLRAQTANEQAKPQDRIDARETGKALKLQALNQQASRDMAMLQFKAQSAASQAERDHWKQQMDVIGLQYKDAERQIHAGTYTYNTGQTVSPFQGAIPTPGAPPAAPGPATNGIPAPAGLPSLVRPTPGNAQDVSASVNAMFPLTAQNAAAAEGAGIRQRELMPNGGGMIPSANVLSAPISPVHGGVPAPAMVAPVPSPAAPATAVPPQGAPAPRQLTIADAPAGMTGKSAQKWLLDQSKAADLSSPESKKAVEFWSEVVSKGGSLPPGLARTPEGAALVKEVMKQVSQGQTKPIELMSSQAEFMGEKAGQRTLGTRTANIEMAATEAAGLSKLALQASEEWNRTGIKTLNDLEKYAQGKTASPELRRFVAANTSFINAYARAINPQGVGTVADKEHAREMLEVGFSKNDYAAAINQLQAEIRTAQQSPGQVKQNMRERFTGQPETAAPVPQGRKPLSAFEAR